MRRTYCSRVCHGLQFIWVAATRVHRRSLAFATLISSSQFAFRRRMRISAAKSENNDGEKAYNYSISRLQHLVLLRYSHFPDKNFNQRLVGRSAQRLSEFGAASSGPCEEKAASGAAFPRDGHLYRPPSSRTAAIIGPRSRSRRH